MAVPTIDEVRLDTQIEMQFVGGPMWSTVIIATGSGTEQRFRRWNFPRYRFRLDCSLLKATQIRSLEAFFWARDGRARGFRFKDWADYQISAPTDTVALTATTFQIVKRYTSGGVERLRNIYKVATGTTAVFNQSNQSVAGWTVDANTGIVTFSGAPGYLPRVTCEFDVPVRFEMDAMQREARAPDSFGWSAIDLVELRN